VKGLVLMETLFPTGDNSTVFDDPKLKQQLVKEMKKGTIKPPRTSDEVDVDEDMDSKIDQMCEECWSYYDAKRTGTITRKQAQQFFKDCFQLYALRRRVKPKEALGPGVSMKKALEECVRMLDPSGAGAISKHAFMDFINENDINEILGPFLGNTQPLSIDSRLPPNMMFDPNTLPKDAGQQNLGDIKFRDYNQTLE